MRGKRLGWLAVSVSIVIGACTSSPTGDRPGSPAAQPFAYSAFVAGGDATGLTPQAIAFSRFLETRQSRCEADTTARLGLAAAPAAAFCRCQERVFLYNMTPTEMAAAEEATTGSQSETSTRIAFAAVTRITPERKRICGY